VRALPIESIRSRYLKIAPELNEKSRRLWAGVEALELGYGGVCAVSRATGLAQNTIRKAIGELGEIRNSSADDFQSKGRLRRAGGGRKKLTEKNPALNEALHKLLEPYTSGDPMRPLRWTCKSTRKLADELRAQGHSISAMSVGNLLKAQGFSLQGNRKRHEGNQHPDRNAQFEYIAKMTEAFQSRGCPVISVDTKKKELVGNYKNAGAEWHPKGKAIEVEAYDFIDAKRGKAIPYGIYDTTHNLGWVNVGTDHDTAQFAVASIRQWWENMGEWMYPEAREILIMADGGGSNGSRNRLWKKTLQQWADQEGLKVMVCHFPPATSKWNKIEHRMFCHITQNWRGKPLISHEVIIELIGSTTTDMGLQIKASLDTASYPTGIKVSDEEMAQLSIEPSEFHGEWNYLIKPKT
jgi:hypothetical protein